ncbi:12387_t:CDS:2 [Funneliformis mosseae]|uniref:12387_t:CDS:1 n=1 Tax=Funneliformis mosseae TaxID=27381 RepID=A0A9N9A0R4_FUNMO|nr:12387_t:CDS:2 [Funneliformis mosseae]
MPMPESVLTDHKIIDAILNIYKEKDMMDEDEFTHILEKVSLMEAENSADKIIRFLYEQEPEFGEVNEELKVLKGLQKRQDDNDGDDRFLIPSK